MEWINKCVSSLYSSYSCPSDCVQACLPPIVSEPLPAIQPVECEGCQKPCALHPVVPPNLNIDQTRPLHNTVPPYAIHLIILTGKTDWPAHIEDDGLAKALIEAIHERQASLSRADHPNNTFHPYDPEQDSSPPPPTTKRILVTNASLPSPYAKQRNACDVLLMPDNVIIANITPRRAPALLDFIIYGKSTRLQFTVHPSPYANLILVCGHARKDRRCGTVGPMLQQALITSMKEANVSGQVALVSHLGGHAFAGNMVIYTHQGQRAIWYGRVTPCHCPDIVTKTIQQDRILQNLARGVFEVGCSTRQKMNNACSKALLDW